MQNWVGWKYVAKVATQKIEEFVSANWADHVYKVLKDPAQVRICLNARIFC